MTMSNVTLRFVKCRTLSMLAVKQGADFSPSRDGDQRFRDAEGPGPAMELYGRRGQRGAPYGQQERSERKRRATANVFTMKTIFCHRYGHTYVFSAVDAVQVEWGSGGT